MSSHPLLMKKLHDISTACRDPKDKMVDHHHRDGRSQDTFGAMKHLVVTGIKQCQTAIQNRNTFYRKHGGCKESIETSSRVRQQLRELDSQFAELRRLQLDQARKPKKYGGEEIVAKRGQQVLLIGKHLADVKDDERHVGTVSKDHLSLPIVVHRSMSTTFSNSTVVVDRELTSEESDSLTRWKEKDGELDEMLDEIDKGVGHLGQLALTIDNTLSKQAVMIDELDRQTDKTTTHMATVNQKMKSLLVAVRAPDRFIMDVICLVILLGLVGVVYSQVQ